MVMHYFDANATTPLLPEAEEAWRRTHHWHWHNPGSPYGAAARAHLALEDCRQRLAAMLAAPPETIVFTSGATEANNAVVRHYAVRAPSAELWSSAVEHPCVRESMRAHASGRWRELPVTPTGVLDLATLEARLGETKPALVCVMAANNETGVVQPWREVLALCQQAGVPFHLDAAQWLGKRPVQALANAPLLAGCAHKFGGPKGVGFLRVPSDLVDLRIAFGGDQEHGRRAGTENLPGVAAMLAALEARESKLAHTRDTSKAGRDAFEATLRKRIPEVQFAGAERDRLENTSLVILPQARNLRWVTRLDKLGFAVSTGSACATGKEGPSHVLSAMGFGQAEAERAVRVSALPETPPEAWTQLASAFVAVHRELGAEAPNSAVIEIPT